MRIAIGTLLALVGIQAWASDASEPFIGSWMYKGDDANLYLHLKPEGECLVIASLATSSSGYIVKCSYTVEGSDVTVNWQHEINGQVPPPSHLVFVSDRNLIRVEGESERFLRRTRAMWVR
jgi:hypothetical protein